MHPTNSLRVFAGNPASFSLGEKVRMRVSIFLRIQKGGQRER